MSTNISAALKVLPIRRALLTGLIVLLGIAATAAFIWMQTDHVIAPPGLRLMDELWRLFICRCPPL